MNLGQRIEKIAEAKGFKAPKLGDAMGVSKAQIYRIIKADDLSTEVLRKAAEVLGVSIVDFFNESPVIAAPVVQQDGGVNAAGKRVKQKNYGPVVVAGQGVADAAQILEQLTLCQQERESWNRERSSLQEVISTQREMIAVLKESKRL